MHGAADVKAVEDRIVGCLLGGAIGDALGAGIEFLSLTDIRAEYGPEGVVGFVPAYGRRGAITDDTQMTLFTVEGVIRTSVRFRSRGIADPVGVMRRAYQRWLATQTVRPGEHDASGNDGWLSSLAEVYARRAPGGTCLGALRDGGTGSVSEPINSSKGCGGVMRAAPAGFPALSSQQRFQLGCDYAAITHGHPDGYLPAGFLAAAVGELLGGAAMEAALDEAERVLAAAAPWSGTLAAVRAARRLATHGLPSPEALEQLGGGWVGDEALAIAVACVASGAPFRQAVLAAVNHSGDSDSTGSIAGNLLGAAVGVGGLPQDLLGELEMREVIERLGRDAALEIWGDHPADEYGEPTDEWRRRYPGF